jgi:hypothetical protein
MRIRQLLLVVLVFGCSKSEPNNEGKRLPQLPPPPSDGLPSTISIAVAVDGQARPAITAETLAATQPDWSDAQRKAWRIAKLVGVEPTAQVTFAVTGTRGVMIEMPAESADHKLVPALLLSQRGAIVAEFIDPDAPFPAFHGEGGRLGRPPDPTPRVSNVTKIEVRRR